MNLEQQLVMPSKLQTSVTDVGVLRSKMALTFFGSDIPQEFESFFGVLTLEWVHSQTSALKSLEYFFKSTVVLILVPAKDKYSIADIDCYGAGYDEVKTLVEHEAKTSGKSGHTPGFQCQLQLVVTLIKINLTEDGCAV